MTTGFTNLYEVTDFANCMTHRKAEIVKFTPESAMDMLTRYNRYARQRKIDQRKVQEYAELLRRGLFNNNSICVIWCSELQEHFLLNGQHTLEAILESGVTKALTYETGRVETEEQLNYLYTTYDPPQAVRTRRAKLKASDVARKTDIVETEAGRLSAAVAFLEAGFSRPRQSHDSIVIGNQIGRWAPAYKRYIAAIKDTPLSQSLLRRDFMAPALATFHFTARGADFWGAVARDDGLRQGDPRKALVNWIMRTSGSGRGTGRGFSSDAGNAEASARAVASAWNAWWSQGTKGGRDLQVLRAGSSSAPITLLGTPINNATPETIGAQLGLPGRYES